MKAIKMFGLAALTALMAMAFVGASSAMAESTALCKADESPCKVENLVTSVHETSVGTATLLSSVGNTTCEVLFSGSVKEAGNPLVISGSFTYTNCALGGTACTATEESGPSEIKVLKEGHETGKVTGEGLVHLKCGAFIDCSYNGTGLVGTAKGPLLSAQEPDNGEVSLSEQSTTKEAGGFLCPKTAKLDIVTTPLSATYISATPPMVCVFVGTNNGFYAGGSTSDDGKCTNKQGSRTGEYELGFSGTTTLSAHVCAFVGTGNGKWLTYVNSGECANSHSTFIGSFALGAVS